MQLVGKHVGDIAVKEDAENITNPFEFFTEKKEAK